MIKWYSRLTSTVSHYYYIHTHTQGVSVKRFRTPKRVKVHPDDSKSYSNAGSEKSFRCSKRCYAKVPSFRAGNHDFAQGRQTSRVADCTNAELAHMDLVYGAIDCLMDFFLFSWYCSWKIHENLQKSVVLRKSQWWVLPLLKAVFGCHRNGCVCHFHWKLAFEYHRRCIPLNQCEWNTSHWYC